METDRYPNRSNMGERYDEVGRLDVRQNFLNGSDTLRLPAHNKLNSGVKDER
jgi:hypothetical protein